MISHHLESEVYFVILRFPNLILIFPCETNGNYSIIASFFSSPDIVEHLDNVGIYQQFCTFRLWDDPFTTNFLFRRKEN